MISFCTSCGQVIPDFVGTVNAVQQEDAARGSIAQHIDALEEGELVAGHKLSAGDQVRRADGLGAKAQVRDGDRAGFLRVVDEVTLGVVFGFFADDLDRVLVRANRAIRAQAEEHALHGCRDRGSRKSGS